MDKEAAIAIEMAIDGQRDFDTKLLSVLIRIAKALPEESRMSVASEILELIEDHRAGLEDMRHLHDALHNGISDEK